MEGAGGEVHSSEYRVRLKLCAQYCSDNYDVASLCNELPQRLVTLEEKKGDRINK